MRVPHFGLSGSQLGTGHNGAARQGPVLLKSQPPPHFAATATAKLPPVLPLAVSGSVSGTAPHTEAPHLSALSQVGRRIVYRRVP